MSFFAGADRRRFAPWLLSSALVHAAASAALMSARSTEHAPPAPALRIVRVDLVAPEAAGVPAAPPAPAPAQAPAPEPTPRTKDSAPRAKESPAQKAPRSLAPAQPAPAPAPRAAEALANLETAPAPGGTSAGAEAGVALAAVAAGPPGPPGGAEGETLAAYVARVQRMIDAEKSYPAIARRRGIEGVVTVRLAIDAAGALERTALVGRPPEILARSTREAVGRAGPFPPPPAGALQIEFPVRYEIVE